MRRSCSQCTVCDFLDQSVFKPELSFEVGVSPEGDTPLILVLDDASSREEAKLGVARAKKLLGDRPFTYSQTVRCAQGPNSPTEEQLQEARSHCSVWTHHLADNRLLLLATPAALRQLKLERECVPGDLFKSVRLGIVLCIPPLPTLSSKSSAWEVYETKLGRALKGAGL